MKLKIKQKQYLNNKFFFHLIQTIQFIHFYNNFHLNCKEYRNISSLRERMNKFQYIQQTLVKIINYIINKIKEIINCLAYNSTMKYLMHCNYFVE